MAQVSHVRGALRGSSPKQGQYVFIATPTYTGKLDTAYVHALMYSMRRLEAEGIDFDHYVLSYNCHVDDGRNAIVRDFLATECTDLVFLDADVAWEPEALVKLIQHDRDVVAGVYPKRQKNDQTYPVWVEPGTELKADKDGLVEVVAAPTGFMKIKRHVIEKLVEANKERQYLGQSHQPGDKPYTLIFERTFEDGHRWSGDYAFCRKWNAMGGKVFVDPEMYLSHTGEVEFSGTLGQYWREKHGLVEAEKKRAFAVAIDALRSGSPKAQDFMALIAGWNNHYAADVELLATCFELAKELAPGSHILETGCGLTSVVMALANPHATVHSLEHDAVWASSLKYFNELNQIGNIEIHFGPLADYATGKWYDMRTVPPGPFGLVLCDGPPRKISNRSLLFTLLSDRISEAVVLLDDADDAAATDPIERWSKRSGRQFHVFGQGRRFAVSFKAPDAADVRGGAA